MSSVSEAALLAAMSKVMDPELHQDLVKLGMVKDVQITGNKVKFKIELTTAKREMVLEGRLRYPRETQRESAPPPATPSTPAGRR